jgi:hypothetical protein
MQLNSGVECAITLSIPTIKGGSTNRVAIEKGRRMSEIANENHLPQVSLLQSVRKQISLTR